MNDQDTIISNMLKAATVENERLRAALNAIGQRATELQQLDICRLAAQALEQKAPEPPRSVGTQAGTVPTV